MRLAELIAGLPISLDAGAPETLAVTGVAHDSRTVAPGDLFVAIPGARHDGRAFAAAAVERGAVAVLGAGSALEGMTVPWLTTADPRALLGPLAARVYGHPDREMLLVGVTGTNGKSTVATLLAAVIGEATGKPAGKSAGFIGTLGYRLGGRPFPGDRTTPEASDLFRILRQMREQGAAGVAMEVSSHALDLHRVDGVSFDVGV
ncbi:MAG TPA: Mur ligase family protein, partial [Thermoanaerobaculia bacterium]|nr:Mur ligase family protein [Thermoanaerobaculia bacterium]